MNNTIGSILTSQQWGQLMVCSFAIICAAGWCICYFKSRKLKQKVFANKSRNKEMIEDIFGNLLKKIQFCAVITNSQGKIIAATDEFAQLANLSPSQIRNQPVQTFFPDDKREQISDNFEKMFAGSLNAFTISQNLSFCQKTKIEACVTTLLLGKLANQKFALSILKMSSESDLKSHSQIKQVQKMEAIGQLASGIAHDFNNLLSSILGHAELILLNAEDRQQTAKFAEAILQTAIRASDLTKKMLTFTRKSKSTNNKINTHNIVEETVELLSHSIERRVQINTDLQAESTTVCVDPSELQNALLNLGINSRDAMPTGGNLTLATRNIEVTKSTIDPNIGQLAPGKYIEISVRDQGSGISPDIRDRIFEPFFTTKSEGKGTGLGLAMVFNFAVQNQGIVTVDSQYNTGTCFSIYLPCKKPIQPAPKQATAEVVSGKGHILVVDDEEIVRDFTSKMLRKLGYNVSTCNDGPSAIDFYTQNHSNIDLILLDMVMPNMDGFDTFHKLREIDSNVKIMICSGFAQNQTVGELLSQGALGFITKPFQIAKLSQDIASNIIKAS